MRSRRQGVSDAVSVLGMDPWKDDRLRDFVAINTIQRLHAYHLPPGSPMPPVDSVNVDRALNLLLLPRAEPDYRPCAGERPPTRAEMRVRRRAREREQRRGRDGDDEESGATEGSQSSSSSSTASSDGDEGDDTDEEKEKAPLHEGTDSAGLAGDSSDQTPARQPLPDHPSHSPEASADAAMSQSSSSTVCAIDRARALFFGAASFHSSTSPRRLLNSPHVPLTPSVTSTSPHQESLPPASSATRAATTTDEGVAEGDGPRARLSTASRSLNGELDAYIEANSTPLRPLAPPPPLQPTPPLNIMESTATIHRGSDGEENEGEEEAEGVAVDLGERSPNREGGIASDVGKASEANTLDRPLDATPATAKPTAESGDAGGRLNRNEENASDGDEGSMHRSCDACDAIIQYYQSMLTRGVVLDRYNHKDLAFAWWVLGRNMDTAALQSRGPMRREALLITIRNLYYSLLSAEEAKKTKEAAAAKAAGSTGASDRAAGKSARGEPEDTAQTKTRAQVGAETASSVRQNEAKEEDESAAASAPATRPRGRGRRLTVSSFSPAVPQDVPPSARKRPRSGQDVRGVESDGEADTQTEHGEASHSDSAASSHLHPPPPPQQQHPSHQPKLRQLGTLTEGAHISTIATRAQAKVPPLPLSRGSLTTEDTALTTPPHQGSLAPVDTTVVPGSALEPLAAALRGDETSQDGPPTADDSASEASASLVSSATASRAGSIAPSFSRRRRCAEDRRRALEETWTSTRTNRRIASAKAVEQLAQVVPTAEAGSRARRPTATASLAVADERDSKTGAAVSKGKAAPTKSSAGKPEAATAHVKAVGEDAVAPTPKPKSKATSKRSRSPISDSSDGSDEEDVRVKGADVADRKSAEECREEKQKKPRGKARQPATKRTTGSTTKAEEDNGASADAASKPEEAEKADTAACTHKKEKPPQEPPQREEKEPPKQPEKKEEHRGRPRGSFKLPRIMLDGVPVAGTASNLRKAGVLLPPTASRGKDKKRQETTAIGALFSALAVSASSNADSKQRRLAPTAAAPVSRELPLGLTTHERAVRARIQQRMGQLLEPPRSPSSPAAIPASSPSDGAPQASAELPMDVYSSYTFLLSSFAVHGQLGGGHRNHNNNNRGGSTATTAPALWYGPAAPSAAHAKSAEKEGETSAAPLARLRGRRKKPEGGVDPALLGPPMRHDQAVLESQVNARLAQEAAEASPRSSCPPPPSRAKRESAESVSWAEGSTAAVKREGGADGDHDDDDDDDGADDGVTTRVASRSDDAASSSAASVPLLYPFSSSVSDVTQPTTFSRGPASPSPPSSSGFPTTNTTTSAAKAEPAPQPPADFADLTYAQQCLLVWTAGDLLEQHIQRRQTAEARRERLLARYSRMATRRMAARVAAVVESGLGEEETDDASAQRLVQPLTNDGATAGAGQRKATEDGHTHSYGSRTESDSSGDDDSNSGSSGEEEREAEPHTTRQHSRSHRTASAAGMAEDKSGESDGDDASSVSSIEASHKAMRPLPRRVYDYWAAYRLAGTPVVSTDASVQRVT